MHLCIDLLKSYILFEPTNHSVDKSEHLDAKMLIQVLDKINLDYSNTALNTAQALLSSYFNNLYTYCPLTLLEKITSLSIAVPFYYGLKTRSLLRNILIDIFHIENINIVPRSMAIVNAYNLLNPIKALQGDILLMDKENDSLAMISCINNHICLEKEYRLNESLNSFILEKLNFDHILFCGKEPDLNDIEAIFPSHKENFAVCIPESKFLVAKGLSNNTNCCLDIIYPYEFFIGKHLPQSKSAIIEKISFDTSNLELKLCGKYKIKKLSHSELNCSSPQRLYIYEIARNQQAYLENIPIQQAVLEISFFEESFPEFLNIYLDMNRALLYSSSENEWTDYSDFDLSSISASIQQENVELYKLLKLSQIPSKLVEDFQQHLLKEEKMHNNPLNYEINKSLYKLYSLLQLWYAK